MKPTDNSTHRPRAIDPKTFRDQATGIGQARCESAMTGAMRNARVSTGMTAQQAAAVPAAEGFVKPLVPAQRAPAVEAEDSGFGDSGFCA